MDRSREQFVQLMSVLRDTFFIEGMDPEDGDCYAVCQLVVNVAVNNSLSRNLRLKEKRDGTYRLAQQIMVDMDSRLYKPPVARERMYNNVYMRVIATNIDQKTIPDLKGIINHINGFRGEYQIRKSGSKAELLHRVKVALYIDYIPLFDGILNILKDRNRCPRILLDRIQRWSPPARATVDLTSPEPRVVTRPRYWQVHPSDEIFSAPLGDVTASIPLVRDEPVPFAKSDELEVVSETHSNRCPISMKPILTPVRGKNCKHTGCFDLASFLLLAQQQKSWKCPLCAEEAEAPHGLVISERFVIDNMLD